MDHHKTHYDVEVPLTYSPQEAVGLIQDAGVVGAGGAGFPTHVKYQKTVKTLVMNACESEPGYYTDKLLMQEEPGLFADLFTWMEDTFSMERFAVAAEEVAKPYLAEWEGIANVRPDIETFYVPPVYKLGEEKALIKHLFHEKIPKGDIPPQHGYIVNNVETLHNVHHAVVDELPVTTKLLHLYGEGFDRVQALEAPVGAGLRDLMSLLGADPEEHGHCKVYDGGPLLSRLVCDPLADSGWTPVTKTTNAFLVTHPEKDRPRFKHYPHPDYEGNTIDAPWAASEIRTVTGAIDRVRVPLTAKYVDAGRTVVHEGDTVVEGDTLVTPLPEGLSIGVHASIPGTVTQITKAYIEIER